MSTVELVAISNGLKEGELVVTEGADRLKDGASVMLQGDTPTQAPGASSGRRAARGEGGGRRGEGRSGEGRPGAAAAGAAAPAAPAAEGAVTPAAPAPATAPAAPAAPASAAGNAPAQAQ